jgi:hypothetical protein
LLIAEGIIYGSALVISGANIALKNKNILHGVGIILAIVTMHFSWGAGFLWSLLVYSFDKIFKK